MKLSTNWRMIVKKAWSFRLLVIAGMFTTAEAILPYFTGAIPRGTFALLTLVSVTGGMIARIVAQKEFKNE